MKRSEMIELMTNSWYDFIKSMDQGNSGVKNGMNYVLKQMERSGIKPPYCSEFDEFLDGRGHKWEPEND